MASITPNPKKRGYLLPPGCKDLIDVLNLGVKPKFEYQTIVQQFSELTDGGESTGKLTDIGRFVSMVFESRGLMWVHDKKVT